jgi:hypothetical protein
LDAGLVKLLEVVLLFGAVVAFGVWQLRSVDRDRRARLEREAAEARGARADEPPPPRPPDQRR